MSGGMHGRGTCVAQGTCMAEGVHGRGGFMTEGGVRIILSMSGRYASYWNVFLFKLVDLVKFIPLY